LEKCCGKRRWKMVLEKVIGKIALEMTLKNGVENGF
jgi:hypothetical protein